MADLIGLFSNEWTAGSSETSHESTDFTAVAAKHDMHDTHDAPDARDVGFTDKIDQAKPSRFISRFKTSATMGFQPTELGTTEYITNQMKVIVDGPRLLSDQAINWIRATEDIQLEMIDANLCENLEDAEKFAKTCDLNESLAAKVKDLEDAEPIQDSPSRELAAAQQEIEELEEELQIEKCRSAKLERQLDKWKSKPETTEETDFTKLQLEKDILLHQVKNLLSEKTGLESELRAFEHVIQPLMTDQ